MSDDKAPVYCSQWHSSVDKSATSYSAHSFSSFPPLNVVPLEGVAALVHSETLSTMDGEGMDE